MKNPRLVFVTPCPRALSGWIEYAKKEDYAVTLIHPDIQSDEPVDLSQYDLSQTTVVVEWMPIKHDRKIAVLQQLEEAIPKDALILSASHEMMATLIASFLKYSERLVGFSPFSVYRNAKLVELAPAMQASKAMKAEAWQVLEALNLDPVWIDDTPGMVMPRIYAMLANEAAFTLQEQVATAEDIDTAMKLGTNYPMGPLEWADKVGIETVIHILENAWQVYRHERYRPCVLLQKMVMAGRTGRRAGQGFYTYPEPSGSGQTSKEAATTC